MTYMKSALTLVTGLALAAGLGVTAMAEDVTTLNGVGPDRDFPRVSRAYDTMNRDFSRTGVPRSVAQVRRIAIGSTKRQLVAAVGQPVSAYGDGSWNFNVALSLPQSHKLICQYRVYFDDADRVQGTLWRRPQCADIITRGRK